MRTSTTPSSTSYIYAENAIQYGSGDTGNNIYFYIGVNTSGYLEILGRNGSGTNTYLETVTTTNTINDGNWHHVVWTRDKSINQTNYLYIDGVVDVSNNDMDSDSGTSGPNEVTIGAFMQTSNTTTGHFTGDISELKIYSRAFLSLIHI